MIRKALISDVPAIVELCIEELLIDPYKQLVLDEEKILQAVKDTVGDSSEFAWVSEQGGKITGALGAIVLPLMMYERKQAQIVIWYCKTPGDGMKLLREFMRWVRERPFIKQVIYSPDHGADPRIGKAIMRAGFNEVLPTYVLTR